MTQNNPQHALEAISDEGQGRVTLAVCENNALQLSFFHGLRPAKGTRLIKIVIPEVEDANWRAIAAQFRNFHKERSLKHLSYVAFGGATTIVQYEALTNLRNIRTIVLVDATMRPHPSLFLRIVDKIEEKLPLGLPLRFNSDAFDSKPFLQRIRCPILVVTTRHASQYELEQAKQFLSVLPVAWGATLKAESGELNDLLMQFSAVQAKSPQRKQVVEKGIKIASSIT
jgi:hypothetical protein